MLVLTYHNYHIFTILYYHYNNMNTVLKLMLLMTHVNCGIHDTNDVPEQLSQIIQA
jgi:hypothetical protein